MLRLGGISIAHLAEWTPEQADPYLNAGEVEQWSRFSREKRRSEWLAGRLAAKWAAGGMLAGSAVGRQTLTIHTEEDGRPYVRGTHAVAPFISISHSGPLAAALAANLPCGLDIQEPVARIIKVRERFASMAEEDILTSALPGSFTETERLTLLWSAKEAARKLVRISPLLGLLEQQLLAATSGHGTPEAPLSLILASNRNHPACPATISILCFYTDNLAWAIAFSMPSQKE